jgi:hypothetical protein
MAKTAKPDHALNHGIRRRGNGARRVRVAYVDTDKEGMTPLKWQGVIEATALGKTRKEAAKSVGISKRVIDAYLISNISAHGQLRDARLLHLRRAWPSERVEDFLILIARGKTMQAAADKMDIGKKSLGQLYSLFLSDKVYRKIYDEARELQAETFVDKIIEVSEDSDRDRDDHGKINHEVVNRSKLRVDTLKWVMGAMVKKRFGDIKHIELEGNINLNHAAILSGGRRRLEQLNSKRKGVTVDNSTGAEVAAV